MMALVRSVHGNIDYDVLLYDPQSNQNRRGEFVANMVKESGAQGLGAVHAAVLRPRGDGVSRTSRRRSTPLGSRFIKLGIDQQMRDFGQAADRHPGVCRRALRAVRKVSFPSCRARQEGKAVKNAQKVHTRLQIEQSLCYNPN